MRSATYAVFGLTLAVGLFGFVAEAETYRFTGTGTYSSKGYAETDLMDGTKWEGGAPTVGNDYVIDGAGNPACGFSGPSDTDFLGDSLTIGSASQSAWLVKCGTGTSGKGGICHIPLVIIKNGGFYDDGVSSTVTLTGILSNESAQAEIRFKGTWYGQMNNQMTWFGAGNVLVQNMITSASTAYNVLRMTGNADAYSGTFLIGRDDKPDSKGYQMTVLFGDHAPRNVTVQRHGEFGACAVGDNYGRVTLGNFTLNDQATLLVAVSDTTNTTFCVTNTCALPASGTVNVRLCALPNSTTAPRRMPLLIAPAGTGLSESKFVLTCTSTFELICKMSVCSLAVESDDQGREVLYLDMDKFSVLKSEDAWKHSAWTAADSANWYGIAKNTELEADRVYLVYNKKMYSAYENAIFGGKRLAICGGSGQITFNNGTFVVDDFRMFNGGTVVLNAYRTYLYGSFMISTPMSSGVSGTFKCCDNYQTEIYAAFTGDGTAVFQGTGGNPRYLLHLLGDNSAFAGKFALSNVANHPATNLTVRIADSKALGGALSAFAYDGISISRWSILRASSSVALDEPTRGLYVEGDAIIQVDNATNNFHLASQTTLAGQLVKQGAGTLVLGGALKFTSAQLATPLEGTNVLTVSAGRIRPASKDGANGLAIAFAAKTGLRFAPLAETDADVAKYGLYDVAWPTPFDLTATDGKLDVAVDVPEGTKDSFSFGICTVDEDAADALDGNIVIPKIKGLKGSVVREPAVDGAVTFRADYERRGLMLIFR